MRDANADCRDWLAGVRARFAASAPDLLDLFDLYAAEARFGRSYIAADLAALAPGARVLEIGAGSLLLSCQLVREGFQVTALEPTGEGFSHFDRMRAIVRACAEDQACCPRLLEVPAEELSEPDRYDFAFSVNVMEHVKDPARVLASVGASLRAGARYRFTCPNYLFPYEPHFNIPTLWSKGLTGKLLWGRIAGCQRVTDPEGTWASLNWITVPQVRRCVRRLEGLRVAFDRRLLVATLERVLSDRDFTARRSPALRKVIGVLVRSRLHRLFGLVPAALQPLMDCSVEKLQLREQG
jgi:SAM-dependent methyltransferase